VLDSLVGLVSMRMPMLLLLDRIGKDMRMLFVQDASAKLNCCKDTYLFTKHRCKLLVKAETGLGRGPLHRDDMIKYNGSGCKGFEYIPAEKLDWLF
jgi:hypothetical protein